MMETVSCAGVCALSAPPAVRPSTKAANQEGRHICIRMTQELRAMLQTGRAAFHRLRMHGGAYQAKGHHGTCGLGNCKGWRVHRVVTSLKLPEAHTPAVNVRSWDRCCAAHSGAVLRGLSQRDSC